MKKIEEKSWLYGLVYGGATALMGIILYPLFDFIIFKFFTNSKFTYSFQNYIILPLTMGFIIGLVLAINKERKLKNKKK